MHRLDFASWLPALTGQHSSACSRLALQATWTHYHKGHLVSNFLYSRKVALRRQRQGNRPHAAQTTPRHGAWCEGIHNACPQPCGNAHTGPAHLEPFLSLFFLQQNRLEHIVHMRWWCAFAVACVQLQMTRVSTCYR